LFKIIWPQLVLFAFKVCTNRHKR